MNARKQLSYEEKYDAITWICFLMGQKFKYFGIFERKFFELSTGTIFLLLIKG